MIGDIIQRYESINKVVTKRSVGDDLLGMNKKEEKISHKLYTEYSNNDNKNNDNNKQIVWQFEWDWLIYLCLWHMGAIYGVYCFFYTKWLTVIFSEYL